MLQIIYTSTACDTVDREERVAILEVSRRNNVRDSITGLLYSDEHRFLQALEGPSDRVEATYARIQQDERHKDIKVISRREIQSREFGDWAMASRTPDGDESDFLQRMSQLTQTASPSVRATIRKFIDEQH
jgi:hypothetical protein